METPDGLAECDVVRFERCLDRSVAAAFGRAVTGAKMARFVVRSVLSTVGVSDRVVRRLGMQFPP